MPTPFDLDQYTPEDSFWMQWCLDLAFKGTQNTYPNPSPNPKVGCVLVNANNQMIAEGFHCQYGGPHAEVEALKGLPTKVTKGSTLYVNLEPCTHQGKTPPCVDAVIAAKPKRVVIGMLDPNPKVAGGSIAKLEAAGIEVTVGVKEDECHRLNEAFCHNITTGMPFVQIKTALSLDGYIATSTGESQWITNEGTRQWVHSLRAHRGAILSTAETVIKDNAQLTVRGLPYTEWSGQQPVRVILDRELRLTPDLQLFESAFLNPIFIFTKKGLKGSKNWIKLESLGVKLIETPELKDKKLCLKTILQSLLKDYGIIDILVEAGSKLTGSLIQENLVQKLWLTYGNQLFGDEKALSAFHFGPLNKLSEAQQLKLSDSFIIDNNIVVEGYFDNP